jgi:hypothetical protein
VGVKTSVTFLWKNISVNYGSGHASRVSPSIVKLLERRTPPDLP